MDTGVDRSPSIIHKKDPAPIASIDINTIKRKLRSYHIDRNPEYFGFGIILHTDKDREQDSLNENAFLLYPSLEIEKNSPADVTGLQTGQHLIAVNGKFINKDYKTINSLAQAIDDSYYQRGSTDFLVLDQETWESIKSDQSLLNELANLSINDLQSLAPTSPQTSQKPKRKFIRFLPHSCCLIAL